MTSKQRAYLKSLANPIDPILHVGKGGISDTLIKQADDALQILVAGKGIVGDNAHSAQIHGILQVTAFKGALADDLHIVLAAEGNLLQRGTAIKCAVLDGVQGRGQNHFLQTGGFSEGMLRDHGDTFGNPELFQSRTAFKGTGVVAVAVVVAGGIVGIVIQYGGPSGRIANFTQFCAVIESSC